MTQWRGTPHLGTRLWELARAPHGGGKIRRFLTKQLLLSYNTDDSSPFRSSLWPWNEADRRLRSVVLLWSPPASYHSAAALPKTRRCVPPPKKAETFRQGRASLTRPILSLAGLLNKDQTHWVCTSQGLLYNRSLCCCSTHSTKDAAQKRGLHLTNCTQQCLQRACTAMHISSLMDDDDWDWALMPVCITVRDLHTLRHTSVTFLNEATGSLRTLHDTLVQCTKWSDTSSCTLLKTEFCPYKHKKPQAMPL